MERWQPVTDGQALPLLLHLYRRQPPRPSLPRDRNLSVTMTTQQPRDQKCFSSDQNVMSNSLLQWLDNEDKAENVPKTLLNNFHLVSNSASLLHFFTLDKLSILVQVYHAVQLSEM